MWPAIIIAGVAVGALWLLSRYGYLGNALGALSSNPGVPGYLMIPKGLISTDCLKRIHWIHWRAKIQGYARLQLDILPWVKARGFKLTPTYTTSMQCQPDSNDPSQWGNLPEHFQPYLTPGWTIAPHSTTLAGGLGVSKTTYPKRPNALSGADMGLWVWPPSVFGDGDASAGPAHVRAWLAHWEACMMGRWHSALTIRKQYMSGVDMVGDLETFDNAPAYRIAVPPFYPLKGHHGSQETWAPHAVTSDNVLACYLWTCSYLASWGLLKGPQNLPVGPQNANVNAAITKFLKEVNSPTDVVVTPGRPDAKVKALAKGLGTVIGMAKGAKAGNIYGTGLGVAAQLVTNIVKTIASATTGRIGKAAWHDDWTPVWVHHSVLASAKDLIYCKEILEGEMDESTWEGRILLTVTDFPLFTASAKIG